jgi:metallo-beta-lactamase family protein
MHASSLTFAGGAGTVTGSKYLVDTGRSRILLDCGLFQGLSSLRRRNWAPPPFAWTDVDAVVLTHAHLDHTGYLPLLARHGWRGPVFATEGTARLAEIVLADSAHLLEEEAEHAAAGGWSKHHPPLPLYDRHDAARASRMLRPVPFGQATPISDDVELLLGRAGHILGSSWAQLTVADAAGARRVLTSGDLGRQEHPVLLPPEPRPETDVLLIESTYGDRQHAPEGARQLLADAITRTADRGGSVLIPAFSVDRTEVILTELAKLRRAGRIPDLPVVLDSPMALACLRVYREARAQKWPELRPDAEADAFDPAGLVEVADAEESARWNDPRMPAIIISASGMATGGRVLYHLRGMLPNNRHTVAVVGFAAEGTRARQLVDGATALKIHGRYVPVRAEVVVLDAFSAHADADELYAWATAAPAPEVCYVVHGEARSSRAFADRLHADAGWTAVPPTDGERVLI